MKSEFTGGVFANYFFKVAVVLVTLLTLGIAYPFINCAYMRWRISHTRINGKKLVYVGNGTELFKKYIVWLAVSYITLYIYFVVKMQLDLVRYDVEHTHIEGRNRKSHFECKWYELIFAKLSANLLCIITFSFGACLADCCFYDWFSRRAYIDGEACIFNGTATEMFCKYLLWGLLTTITLSIYQFWFVNNAFRWRIEHTEFIHKENVAADKYVVYTPVAPRLPDSVPPVEKPVVGKNYIHIMHFMALKRAMMCFVCGVPVFVGATVALALKTEFGAAFMPLVVWLYVLLSLPAIFLPEEKLSKIADLHLNKTLALAVIGTAFSISVPIFLPVFIVGIVKTVKLKEELFESDGKITEVGVAVMEEQEVYFDGSVKWQNYQFDCQHYRKAVKNYANAVIFYEERKLEADKLIKGI